MIGILFLMTLISLSMRILPFIFSNTLRKFTLLDKFTTILPSCILLILVAHTLEKTSCGLPEIIALLSVVLSQYAWRSVLISMAIGVILHQTLLHLV